MGWRGTIRSIAAAQRRAERESVRRHREYARQQHLAAKLAECLERAHAAGGNA